MTVNATPEELQAGRGYENLFVPALFSHWPEHLLDAAQVQPGDRVLDIACGSGVLARAALKRATPAGHVTGLDPAPGMLAAAAEVAPDIEWVQGVAEDLPFSDASYDRVLCQFGMMFFQDKAKGVAEMMRVLKPGGGLVVGTWQPIEANPAYGDIVAVLDSEVGKEAGDAVRMPFILGDEEDLRDIFANAGFADIEIAKQTEQASFPSPQTMVEVELRGWLPLFGINLDETKISEVMAEAGQRLAKYETPSGEAVFPASALIVSATKPA